MVVLYRILDLLVKHLYNSRVILVLHYKAQRQVSVRAIDNGHIVHLATVSSLRFRPVFLTKIMKTLLKTKSLQISTARKVRKHQ